LLPRAFPDISIVVDAWCPALADGCGEHAARDGIEQGCSFATGEAMAAPGGPDAGEETRLIDVDVARPATPF